MTCFHVFEPSGCRSPISLQLGRGSEVTATAGDVVAEVAVSCGGSHGYLEPSKCSCPFRDGCGMPVPMSMRQHQSVLMAVLPNGAGSASAQASFQML